MLVAALTALTRLQLASNIVGGAGASGLTSLHQLCCCDLNLNINHCDCVGVAALTSFLQLSGPDCLLSLE